MGIALNRKSWGWGVIVVVLLVMAGIYILRTKPKAVELKPAGLMDTHIGDAPTGAAAPKQMNIGGDLNFLAKRLADKLAKNPGDGDGWLLLARTYSETNQMQQAAAAYAKAAALLPPDAALFADWANAHVVAQAGQWDAEAKKIVQRALKADAKHLKSLSLAASEAFSRADYKTAIAYWKRLQSAADAGSPDAQQALANIQESKALLGGKKIQVATANPATPPSAIISGSVTLDARLKGRVAASDTLFIIAKAPDGSNPPLAVKRYTVADLPVQFKLDDAAAMIPSRTLSQYPTVTLIARISKSGQAAPAAGDIEAKPVSVKMGSTAVSLNLSSVR